MLCKMDLCQYFEQGTGSTEDILVTVLSRHKVTWYGETTLTSAVWSEPCVNKSPPGNLNIVPKFWDMFPNISQTSAFLTALFIIYFSHAPNLKDHQTNFVAFTSCWNLLEYLLLQSANILASIQLVRAISCCICSTTILTCSADEWIKPTGCPTKKHLYLKSIFFRCFSHQNMPYQRKYWSVPSTISAHISNIAGNLITTIFIGHWLTMPQWWLVKLVQE